MGTALVARAADPKTVASALATATDKGAPVTAMETAPEGLYYVVDGTHGLAAGQRVLLELPLVGSDAPRKVVPYSAVIYDVRGETYVYTQTASQTFVRQRVSLDRVDGDRALLVEGPPAGTQVVTVGATELFGTELKIGK
jgi:hypothetical protein